MKTMTEFDVEAFLTAGRKRVDEALDAALPAAGEDDPGRLKEAMRYAVLQGGKRMRPLVVIAACEAAGGDVEQALPGCCAIELIHAYSLVHDDLPAMDDDRERRGKPTVHVAFGEATAVLVGDALLTHAFEVLASGRRSNPKGRVADAVARLARHAGVRGMVGGQVLDLELGQDVRELKLLERVHAMKTGGLYAASGALGALLAGAPDEVVDELERWGMAFGVAFQHADDVLDGDQPSLRDHAMARVGALVDECFTLVSRYGDRGASLAGIAHWVRDRAHAAQRGQIQD